MPYRSAEQMRDALPIASHGGFTAFTGTSIKMTDANTRLCSSTASLYDIPRAGGVKCCTGAHTLLSRADRL